jgi:hypothetical protein
VAIADPQLPGLPAELDPAAGIELLLLAEAEELAHFGAALPPAAGVFQPGVEPQAKLHGLADGWVLPVLELRGVEQRGGTLALEGTLPRRVAEGGMLRLFAASHADGPVALELAVDGRPLRRAVELLPLVADGAGGRAVRRGLFAARLDGWVREYRLSRDPELRARIVETSLREEIPTELTSLQVADAEGAWAGRLPATATSGPLLRRAGLALVAAALLLWLAAGRATARGAG